MVNFELLKSGLRYLFEIFTICLPHACANLMKKFLLLLNRPARNSPFLPKFWTALATVIVGIFFRKNFWWGLRPISVAYQKEFWKSWKKRRFQIFQKPSSPGFQSFLFKYINRYICTIYGVVLIGSICMFEVKVSYCDKNRKNFKSWAWKPRC